VLFAAQRFADYENEIRVLEAKLRQEQRKNSAPTATVKVDSPDSASPSPTTPQERPGISRFGSFIGSRNKSSPAQSNGTLAPPNGSREKELEEKLIQEQTTRIAAEKKVKEVNAEIEDLSATLFQQANEMVAVERKEKADLTEKNNMLREQIEKLELEQKENADLRETQKQESVNEKQAAMQKAADEKLAKENERLKEKLRRLEQREVERKKRLERLEAASKRVERVKAMLQPP
jgi:DNA repair exonuclease SbcCD ATPase subunit